MKSVYQFLKWFNLHPIIVDGGDCGVFALALHQFIYKKYGEVLQLCALTRDEDVEEVKFWNSNLKDLSTAFWSLSQVEPLVVHIALDYVGALWDSEGELTSEKEIDYFSYYGLPVGTKVYFDATDKNIRAIFSETDCKHAVVFYTKKIKKAWKEFESDN